MIASSDRLLKEWHRWYKEGLMLFCDKRLANDYADECVRAYKSGRLPLSKLPGYKR